MMRPRVSALIPLGLVVGVVACATGLRPPAPPDRRAGVKLKIGGFIVGNGLRVVTIPEPGAPIVPATIPTTSAPTNQPQVPGAMANN